MRGDPPLFHLLGSLMLLTSIVTVLHRSVAHSVVYFVATALLFSCLLFELGLSFAGAVAMIVHANLGVVLFLLAIAELGRCPDPRGEPDPQRSGLPIWFLSWIPPIGSALLCSRSLRADHPVAVCDVDLRQVTGFLFGRGMLLTEILSLVLLVVVAIILDLDDDREQAFRSPDHRGGEAG